VTIDVHRAAVRSNGLHLTHSLVRQSTKTPINDKNEFDPQVLSSDANGGGGLSRSRAVFCGVGLPSLIRKAQIHSGFHIRAVQHWHDKQ